MRKIRIIRNFYSSKNQLLYKIIILWIAFKINLIYSASLPECSIDKESICTLIKTNNLLPESIYCFSSETGNIYVGIDSTGKCREDGTYMSKPGNYFFNSNYKLMRSANTIEAGYSCYGKYGSDCEEMMDGIYINSASSTNNFVIYYNHNKTATDSKNIFIDNTYKFFLNYGIERELNIDNKAYPLLKCDNKSCQALSLDQINVGFYINSGDTTKKTIIECDKFDCYLITTPTIGYYVNANNIDDSQHPIIHCNESQGICNLESIQSLDPGYYINAGSITNESLIYCNDNECSELTLSNNLNPGYYINAGDSSAPIITCDLNKCTSGQNLGTTKKGSYQFINNSLKFRYIDNDSIGSDSDLDYESLYFFVKLDAGSFPGITTLTETLFKISKRSISQMITEGYISIGKSDLKLKSDELKVDKSVDLYYCSKISKLCSVKTTCTDNTFVLNSFTNKAFYCYNNILKEVTIDGYYIDGGKILKSHTPYLIKCKKNICIRITAPINYYINAGVHYDTQNSDFVLIYCDLLNCKKIKSNGGYYIASDTINDSSNNRGVIYCYNNNECKEFKSSIGNRYYINAASKSKNDILIQCQKSSCKGIKATAGYYISPNSSQLISCISNSECSLIDAEKGYYPLADTKKSKNIIQCNKNSGSIQCDIQGASTGYYISSSQPGLLIDCMSTNNQCNPFIANDGIYRSATTRNTYSRYININEKLSNNTFRSESLSTSISESISSSSSSSRSRDNHHQMDISETKQLLKNHLRSDSKISYNIIICESGKCNEMSAFELYNIPYCIFSNNKCFVENNPLVNAEYITHVNAGDFCTNDDRSIIYFATDEIDYETNTIDVTLSTYTYTTTTTNCVVVSGEYANNYFTVNNQIFRINEGRITKMTNTGYYFINIDKNTLLTTRTEDYYNEEGVKLFKCNGEKCSVIDKPSSITYYSDVNKHILKFDPDTDRYSFPYDNDIICIYNEGKCTPKYDLNTNELCITYKGELALVHEPIIAYETGKCYKSDSISSYTYGLSDHFYEMNSFSARRILTPGYYITYIQDNKPINIKQFSKSWSSSLILYGCISNKCEIYEPKENSYYYDSLSDHVLKYENGIWTLVEKQGFAFINTNPQSKHIHKISKSLNDQIIEYISDSGYYLTIDNDMYECSISSVLKDIECQRISNNDYYFTNDNKVYYCIYDSLNIEKTQCIQQLCIIGQYYFFDGNYYKCTGNDSLYVPVTNNNCQSSDTVVINYPTFMKDLYPDRVKMMLDYMYEVNIDNIENNYNSSYIPSISGIFDSCQYDIETKTATFNLICLKNFVLLSSVNPPKICSIRRMGYIECKEDENHPGMCNPDNAWSIHNKKLRLILFLDIFFSVIYIFYNSL